MLRTLLVGLMLSAVACGEAARPLPAASDGGVDDASVSDAGSDSGADAAVVPGVPLPTRSAETHCVLKGTPSDSLPRIELERIEGVSFDRAVSVLAHPSDPNALFVVEQPGRVLRVELSGAEPTVESLLDLSSTLPCCEGRGLLGAALDPDYDSNGLIFVHYVTGTPPRSIIASFRVDPATGHAPLTSERRVLVVDHPGEGRSGGALLFDEAGMLLVGLGDGGEPTPGAVRDPRLGAILRLEVSDDDAAGYAIPADNPFVASDEQPPEVFAYGFADPSACHIDAVDGQLWCVDVGNFYSEVNAVEPGGDHGWPEIENLVCVETQQLCLDGGHVLPAVGYLNVEGQCRSLGPVPVGAPSELDGALAYADACTGAISALGIRGAQLDKRGALGSALGPIEALGRDADGALVLIDGDGALVRTRLVEDELPGTFPERLSQTGCFEGDKLQDPAADLVAFDVRSPLWSDGTHKRRFFVLPDGARITVRDEGPWELPVGAIIVKEFALPFDDRDPSSVRPIETRFMVRKEAGWEFHSFRWNEQGDDAVRVSHEELVDFEVMRQGQPRTQSYLYPSAATCPVCHSAAPGRVLGPRTEQLNMDVAYEGGARNQLEALGALELFDRMPGSSSDGSSSTAFDALPRLPDPRDSHAPLEARVRSYLQANCAHCHQPGGYSPPGMKMDLRFSKTLAETHICDQAPEFFSGAPKLVAPGDPERSALWVRTRATDLTRMPPVATSVVDPLATVLLTQWIQALQQCPSPAPAAP